MMVKEKPFVDILVYVFVFSTPPPMAEYSLDMLVSQINKLRDSTHRDAMNLIEPSDFKHHSQKELEFLLHHYSEQYPQITRLYDVGESVQGRTLWVIEISDNPGIHEPGIPQILMLVEENVKEW